MQKQCEQEGQKTEQLKADCDDIHQVIIDKRQERQNTEQQIQDKKVN